MPSTLPRLVSALAVFCLLLALSGCDADESAPDTGAADGEKKLTIAVIPKSTGGEFWETVEQGARQAADELGVGMRWEGTLAETEIAEQNKIIENMVNVGV